MSINDYRPQDLASHRKEVSDKKNDTEELTFANPNKPSSHGFAAKQVRDRKDILGIKALECSTDVSELEKMLDEL